MPQRGHHTASIQAPMARGGVLAKVIVAAVVLVLGGLFLRAALNSGGGGGVAAMPAGFEHTSLKAAMDQAQGGPVLAFATADWCGPCQALKKGAMADPRFEQWMTQNGVRAVYLDATNGNDEANQLGVQAIPTLIYFRNGRETARTTGVMPIDRLVSWMEQANKG